MEIRLVAVYLLMILQLFGIGLEFVFLSSCVNVPIAIAIQLEFYLKEVLLLHEGVEMDGPFKLLVVLGHTNFIFFTLKCV